VLYLTHSDPSARTVFLRGVGGGEFVFRNTHERMKPGPFNADKWVAPECAPGDLLLFPSWMLHEVPVNRGGRRMTLAFNAIPERLDAWGYTLSLQP
jgi:ectoine hydroxylase-related dioxygenase (phytanoyl-CoA dioxygenase family)